MKRHLRKRGLGILVAAGMVLFGPGGHDLALAESLHLKINCGDETPLVSGWEDEDAYRTGGSPYDFEGPVDLNDQIDPAPTDVYLTVVHDGHSYLFPVPDGCYLVRLHFYDGPSAVGRAMDYTIEGQLLLDDFNIVEAANGGQKALVREFEIDVVDGDGLSIVADPDQGNDSFEAGMEIIWLDYPPCPDNLTRCVEDCVDTNINPNHCGQCDKSCTRGDLCIQGDCRPDCGTGTLEMDGGCVPASTKGSGCASASPSANNLWCLFLIVVFTRRRIVA